MRVLYIDSADLNDIKEAHSMGIIAGITTNPSLLSKLPKQDYDGILNGIADFAAENNLHLSVEVLATEPNKMLEQARNIHKTLGFHKGNKRLHVKIPIGIEESKVISQLAKEEIKVNATCCFTDGQLKLAALANSSCVSLFYNRARDKGIDVDKTLISTRNFIGANYLDCHIISGSIRKPQDVLDAWNCGSDIVTCSLKIMKELLVHEGTNESLQGFLKDFENWLK